MVLDRWSRRQILVVVDTAGPALALGLAALVATGLRTGAAEALFYGGVLLAMSLNRFLLAALSASLPHTIEPDEYMVANSVVPTVGPAGVLVGAGVGTTLRLVLGADAGLPGERRPVRGGRGGFALSAAHGAADPAPPAGPGRRRQPPRAREIVAGLVDGARGIFGERGRPASACSPSARTGSCTAW